jgi:hypothetical protein
LYPALAFLACPVAQELAEDPPSPPPVWEELLRLHGRIDALERGQEAPVASEPVPIDLSGDEQSALEPNADHVLSRPWYENLTLRGHAALTYLDTGGTGTAEHGSFLIKEASLFLDAQVWERAFVVTEVWLSRFQFGNGMSLGDFYLQLTDLAGSEGAAGLGLKAGRFEIPFGEEYLRWDANETPWISFTAADPYGMDEGLELYGPLGPLGWIAAVTNGNGSGADDGASKQFCGKLYSEPTDDLYFSGSVLSLGETESSALRLSGSPIMPVGSGGASSAGTSPSDDVDALCWELDARLGAARRAGLNLQIGQANIDDEVDAFDRDLTWFLVEPRVRLGRELELLVRWSEIGTYDDDEGYLFEGKIITDGETFGYDTSVLRRASAVLHWTFNPRLAFKLEVGQDHVETIDASALDENNDERLFFALEVVGSF